MRIFQIGECIKPKHIVEECIILIRFRGKWPIKIIHSFFLSWVSKTQPNHWTKRMASYDLTPPCINESFNDSLAGDSSSHWFSHWFFTHARTMGWWVIEFNDSLAGDSSSHWFSHWFFTHARTMGWWVIEWLIYTGWRLIEWLIYTGWR